MKKLVIISLILIIAVSLGVAFTGCNNSTPTQKLLFNSRPWGATSQETLTYDVIYKSATEDEVKGEYVVSVTNIDNTKVTIGDWSIENVSGHLVKSALTMQNGDSITSEVFFNSNVQVKYAMQSKTINGEQSGYTAEYNDEKCYYTYTTGSGENAVKVSDELKVGDFFASPYIDNTMLYQVVRCIPESTSSFSFSVPDVTLGELQSVTASLIRSTTSKVKDATGTEYTCFTATLKLNRTFPGSGEGLKCSIATTPYPSNEDAKVKNFIVQMQEGDTVYTLRTIEYK